MLGPLWVWAGFVAFRETATALGYGLGYVPSWDVFIPALVYVAQFGALHAARYVGQVRAQAGLEAALQARHADLERAARDAQLAALRAQMDPHFLFNTLNTVAASVPPEQGATRDLVARLAGLVRYTLAAARRERVLLREELDFVRDYLALEQERMGARLEVEVVADPAALDALVPPMLVQPLGRERRPPRPGPHPRGRDGPGRGPPRRGAPSTSWSATTAPGRAARRPTCSRRAASRTASGSSTLTPGCGRCSGPASASRCRAATARPGASRPGSRSP